MSQQEPRPAQKNRFSRRLEWHLFFALLISLHPSYSLAADGQLEKLRREVRESPDHVEATTASEQEQRPRWLEEEQEDEPWSDLFGQVLLVTFTSPFWVPVGVLEDNHAIDGYFFQYPYEADQAGFMAIGDLPSRNDKLRAWAMRMDVEYGDSFNNTARIGGHALLQSRSRWCLDGAVDYRYENLALGNQDQLWTGDLNVVYRFAQSETVQFRTGLGFNWLSDRQDSNFGFNFTYAADWLPRPPWVTTAEIDLGSIGEATLIHGRFTAGIQLRQLEIYGGYDYYDVGHVDLSNFVSGIRFSY